MHSMRPATGGSVSSFESSGDEDTEEEVEGGWMGFKSSMEQAVYGHGGGHE